MQDSGEPTGGDLVLGGTIPTTGWGGAVEEQVERLALVQNNLSGANPFHSSIHHRAKKKTSIIIFIITLIIIIDHCKFSTFRHCGFFALQLDLDLIHFLDLDLTVRLIHLLLHCGQLRLTLVQPVIWALLLVKGERGVRGQGDVTKKRKSKKKDKTHN